MFRLPLALPLFCCLLVAAGTANAATPAERYIVIRDGYISEANALPYTDDDAWNTRDTLWLDDLEDRLKELLGPFVHRGFSPVAKNNLETLFPQLAFGRLDGLVYESRDKRTSILVTAPEIFQNWLTRIYDWPGGTRTIGSDGVYSRAMGYDNRVVDLGRIPVTVPAGANAATAMLGLWTADTSNEVPDIILATVVRDDRVFILSQELNTKLRRIPACDRVWQHHWDKNEALEADKAYEDCFRSRVLHEKQFASVLRQTQALLNSAPPLIAAAN